MTGCFTPASSPQVGRHVLSTRVCKKATAISRAEAIDSHMTVMAAHVRFMSALARWTVTGLMYGDVYPEGRAGRDCALLLNVSQPSCNTPPTLP